MNRGVEKGLLGDYLGNSPKKKETQKIHKLYRVILNRN